jgi:beta-ketoacyl ACP synthase
MTPSLPSSAKLTPLALVAIATSEPGDATAYPAHRLARCAQSLANSTVQSRLLAPPPCTPADFRIPPIFERAVSVLTLNLLWLARTAMANQGKDGGFTCDLERTDIVVGVCGGFDSTLRNALKVAELGNVETIAEKKRLLQAHFGSTTHDKIGEMASIIAARIGLELGAHGRIFALENVDATTFTAFQTAALGLTAGTCDMALVAIGQRFEGMHMALALRNRLGQNVVLEEGASVFCLRRLDQAVRDNNHILAEIDFCAAEHVDDTAPSAFGLAHHGAKALRNALQQLPDNGSVRVCGRSLYQQNWAMRLQKPGNTQQPDPATVGERAQSPIAIVGLGASFGPFIGRKAVLQAFGSGTDAIASLSEAALPRQDSFDPERKIPLTSYAQLGSEFAPETAYMQHDDATAPQTDRVHRLAFAVGAEALEQSGLHRGGSSPLRWSVIIATQLCSTAERCLSNVVHRREIDTLFGQQGDEDAIINPALEGLLPSETAMRLSRAFGLNAAGMAVESACASSLAALEIAARQLQLGLCDAALVVAAELPNNPRDLILCSTQRMLSEGKIAPFAQSADGFSPGDGAGAVVLRRQKDVEDQPQPILGLIRGIGGSSDAASFTAPNALGQITAMRRALADAAISPDTIGYVEAHGTGTVRGDSVEIEALNAVYGGQKTSPVWLGSVKSMIGHTFAAAGLAGLIRAVQAVSGATIPPTILRDAVNPVLPLDAGPWAIAQTAQHWPEEPYPRRAAVNGLGTGGTNFHMIIEAANNKRESHDEADHP